MPERLALSLLVVLVAACMPLPFGPMAPTPESSARDDPASRATPVGTAAASATAVPRTAEPTPTSTPTPTPDPDALEQLELDVIGCPGGVVLDWSSTFSEDFHHYTALRSPEREIEPAYPPIAPAVDWGDSYATDRFVTSAVDQSIVPTDTTWHYRVIAFDVVNRPVAASVVLQARLRDVIDLGEVQLTPGPRGITQIDWGLFGGLARCFSGYRILVGPPGTTPSTPLTVVSNQSLTELETGGLNPGETYAVRVEAVRTTTLGELVVGRTDIAEYAVPPSAAPSSAAP